MYILPEGNFPNENFEGMKEFTIEEVGQNVYCFWKVFKREIYRN